MFIRIPASKFSNGKFSLGECARQFGSASPINKVSTPRISRNVADVLARSAFPNARLTLIGEGPERTSLERQVARLGLAGAVDLPGATDDPSPCLRDSDLFVLPSREEGMSVALLEAMALGIPLLATSIPGNRRLIQDFKHGRLVPPDDPEALAKGIVGQWSAFDRAFQLTRAARRRVADEFSIGAVAREHLVLFRALAARRPPAPVAPC